EVRRLQRLKAADADVIYAQRGKIEQQAAWLRAITTERDALKLRVTELEEAERLRDEALEGHWLAQSSDERVEELKAQIAILEQRAPAGYHSDWDEGKP